MTVVSRIRSAVQKRNAYNRTVRELSILSRDTAEDLGISPNEVRSIAHKHVYGH